MLHRVQGIVLRSMDYGEGNKILTIFSRELGKVSVMARGAKKVKSRHTAVTQIFTFADFVFFRTGSSMGSLNSAEIIEPFHKLREHLHMSAYAAYLCEMTDRMIGEEDRDPFLFEQLKASFEAYAEGKDLEIVTHLYEMKVLALAGYMPILEHCAVCGSDKEPSRFSPQLGGKLCSTCTYKDLQAIEITNRTLKLLRLFKDTDIRRLGQIDVKAETKLQLKSCMRGYMDAHIDIRFKSRAFLDQMEKYNL
jgi:DNA repair protein RecO (recombination protein O)